MVHQFLPPLHLVVVVRTVEEDERVVVAQAALVDLVVLRQVVLVHLRRVHLVVVLFLVVHLL